MRRLRAAFLIAGVSTRVRRPARFMSPAAIILQNFAGDSFDLATEIYQANELGGCICVIRQQILERRAGAGDGRDRSKIAGAGQGLAAQSPAD
jgi:hypothetical protein